jgi:5-methylcytosine-specific restriction protein A
LTDHIQPKDEGGSDARENLQRLCRACHKCKTDEDKSKARPL